MKKEKDFYQVSLKVILKNKSGEILILKGLESGTFAGYYDLPGGRIDTDEFNTSFEKILKREIQEEVGDIKYAMHLKPVALGRHKIPPKYMRDNKKVHVLYIFFEAEYLNGNLNISHEHQEFQWIDFGKVKLEKYFTSGILEGMRMYCS